MTDLPPPSSGSTPNPPPPPSVLQPAPAVPVQALGAPRYRIMPFVIPLSAAMVAMIVTRLIVVARTGERTGAAREFLAGTIDEDAFRDRLGTTNGISTVSGLASNVVIVLTIILMYRILTNLRVMGRDTAWSPAWAIFGWILPPGIWVIPALFTSEAWKASSSSPDWRRERTPPVIWLWVVVYAAGTILGVVAGLQLAMTAFDLESVTGSTSALDRAQAMVDNVAMANVGEGVIAVAGVLWLVIVNQLARRHARFTGEQA